MKFSDRDLEITRRREAGELPAELARAFGISPERVWQIVTTVQRHQRGEPPKQRRRYPAGTEVPARPSVRPRIRLWPDRLAGSEWYECVSAGRMGVGATKLEAYARWQSTAPSATSATDASTPTRTAVCVPVEQQPEPTPAQPALTPVHASQVQVLPGVTSRKPLRMTAMLGLNADRIAAAQPRLQSLHGAGRGPNGGFHGQE
ncbi:hypothetical protein ACOTEO_29240 [Achromobacter xylosoxidans]|uniref:hypothetical protein n=1 Tax=Alcaligenes xylosoxydans xylosoxydans TaxID=85698 RepID=UPI0008A5B133|nr:hypothetical protein [Achromobacter xylosoxidans]OFU79631.1 hypothetical protein HMPREF3137_08800 [Achromobacter xylosoxidans]